MKEGAFSVDGDIWVLLRHKFGAIEDSSLGLIAEARRFRSDSRKITAIAPETATEAELEALGRYGVDRVLLIKGLSSSYPRGELLARLLTDLAREEKPSFILMGQLQEEVEIGSRLAAFLDAGFVSHAMDLNIGENGTVAAVRSISDGRLFEEVEFQRPSPYIVSFDPAVLSAASADRECKAEVLSISNDERYDGIKTKVISIAHPDDEHADLEDAEIVVSGGRGIGQGEAFQIMHDLASILGGVVGGTRPVVDQQTLPFERQIGQTGKTVSPRLLFACGISGANEYTAGMEKSQLVVAVNPDPQARIFRFADLGVIGDAHEVIPLLIERIKEIKGNR